MVNLQRGAWTLTAPLLGTWAPIVLRHPFYCLQQSSTTPSTNNSPIIIVHRIVLLTDALYWHVTLDIVLGCFLFTLLLPSLWADNALQFSLCVIPYPPWRVSKLTQQGTMQLPNSTENWRRVTCSPEECEKAAGLNSCFSWRRNYPSYVCLRTWKQSRPTSTRHGTAQNKIHGKQLPRRGTRQMFLRFERSELVQRTDGWFNFGRSCESSQFF